MSTGMDDDLHDPRLRRALDHAPDRDAVPAAHTREAILKMAHNLAAASAPAAGPAVQAAPWWRRLFGSGSPRSRMPWNAAFATVLVATFVTVLWHREPVPDARLDGEAQVAGAPAPASAPPAPAQSAEAPAVAAAPAPAAEPAATADMTPPAAQRSEAARDAKETLKQRETQEAREASRRREASAAAASVQKDEARTMEKAAPAAPVVQAPAPVPAPAPAAPAIASAPMPAAPPMADVGQSPMPYAAAPPAPAVAPAAPAAPAPMQRESADTAPSLAAQGGASANVAGMQRRAAPVQAAPAPASAAKAVATGGFTALDRWTTLDITRAGATTRQARGDTEGLAALVNTVARAATVSGGKLGAPVEARIELRRDGALLAVLEIAGDQVRWTPQPGGPAFIGTPPAQALEALRTALSRAR
ncbi:hypothetical protein BKP43_21150 [Variovorax boronicumulans]|uniref:hypothetical protein n=1 Tax=Variovorax boronicumulans TaxID=436515 RepID=UPI00209C588F|nr:hypothetical protein [Variovorax boronicumulans]PBI92177.1 hypothetical protein BKP43_21150 [Variovorax boronicumulans]